VCLVLGSSLIDFTALSLCKKVAKKWNFEINHKMDQEPAHNLVIVNAAKTGLDSVCGLRIFADIDDVMVRLMKQLDLEIPAWTLQRFVRVQVSALENRHDLRRVSVSGTDYDGEVKLELFEDVKLRYNGVPIWRTGQQRRMSIENLFAKKATAKKQSREEFVFNVQTECIAAGADLDDGKVDENVVDHEQGLCVELLFYRHYQEPNVVIVLDEYLRHLADDQQEGCIVLKMAFDAMEKEWSVGNKREQLHDERVRRLWLNYQEHKQHEEVLPNPYELRNDD